MTSHRSALRAALVLLAALASAACASRAPDPRYRPAENVLEVVAVLRRHVPHDTYRFEPARDFTGKNIYRASLLRLENLERVHADALRAGHMDGVIAFAKGRALERLRAFDLAAASYQRAAQRDDALRHSALEGAAVCDALAEAASIGFVPGRPPGDGDAAVPASTGQAIDAYDTRLALLEALSEEVEGTHYEAVAAEEIERADLLRARHFVHTRHLVEGGDVRALSELQRVALRHRDSRHANEHLLELARLYETLAREYVERNPPESLRFDPPAFAELVDSGVRIYQAVAGQDGTPEKLEAGRRLEAFLAFTLRVDRDRFTR